MSSSCFGGPTSDWPHRNSPGNTDNGDDEPPKGTGTGNGSTSNTPPPVVRDAGKGSTAGGTTKDAGVSRLDASSPSNPPPETGSGGSPDGGVLAPSDAGLPQDSDGGPVADDGGVSSGCTEESDTRDAGGCYGVYCGTTRAKLLQSVSATGSCLDAEDIALACDGALTRVVSACAQDDALTLGLGMTVDDCARMDPSIADATDACIDCYVAEMVCSVQNCLAPCLAGRSLDCTSCRISHCGAAFETCSGLPRP